MLVRPIAAHQIDKGIGGIARRPGERVIAIPAAEDSRHDALLMVMDLEPLPVAVGLRQTVTGPQFMQRNELRI